MANILKQAQENFKADRDAWKTNYRKAKEDLAFTSDEEGAQWDAKLYQERIESGRPAVTIDQLDQFIHQVANDIRQNTPSINVVPSDAGSSQDTAEALKGIIKEIEYYSAADDAYDTASLYSIRCGIGFIRVDHEYINGQDGLQRLCIKRVVNPLSVWINSDSIESEGRDATRGYVIDEITVKEFKKLYPGKDPVSFDDDKEDTKEKTDDDYISLCEYFEIDDEGVVNRYLLSGADVLAETVFPGKYIPLIPVYGEEVWIDGSRYLFSLIRKSKSAARMRNLWKSLETELLLKAPQAPFTAAEGQVEDYAEDWKNPDKTSVLRYKAKDADGNLIGAPQRMAPPPVPTGIVNASMQTTEDIRATMGIYQASLGMSSNEKSGIAIRERRIEGDTATYHFGDNLVRSITQVGRVLVAAIPEIYTEERILRIVGMDEEPDFIGVNGAVYDKQEQTINLGEGDYSVRVQTGASFSTRRQESAQFLLDIINTDPAMMKIFGDLLFKNLDFAGAQTMAERIKKVMEPSVFEDEENPVIMQLQRQLQEQQAVMQAMQAQLDTKQQELQLKAMAEQNDVEEGKAKIELDFYKMRGDQEVKARELAIKEQELNLKQREIELKEAELQAEVVVQGMATNGVSQL